MNKKITKVLCMILCAVILGVSFVSTSSKTFAEDALPESPIIYGDVNGDNEANSLDATLLLKYDAGITDLGIDQIESSDVNGDNNVDSLDASMILKYDAGLLFALYPCPDFSKYETYIDADGHKTIKLLTKDHEMKYEKYNYEDLDIDEMWRLVNDTFYMFREFHRIEIDLNQFGDVTPLNEDEDNAYLYYFGSHAKVTITKDGNEVVKWYARYKEKIDTDNERIISRYERNIRTIKDGELCIDKASLCDYINNKTVVVDGVSPTSIFYLNRDNLNEIYEICLLRIWYYLGMPKLVLNDYSSSYPSSFHISAKETTASYDPDWVVEAHSMASKIHFQKDGKIYDILSVASVFGKLVTPEDGHMPDLPISYIREK